jgi:putative SOS response-associated peptidase YedK
MCGRYTCFATEFADLRSGWNLGELPLPARRYNIAPSQEAPVVIQTGDRRSLEMFRWGLVPYWAKDPTIGNKMINARAETLARKSSFKQLLETRRCLVLADGFYEWLRDGNQKFPMRFKLKSGESFAFAGLWDSWVQPHGEPLRTYTIITTEANDLLRPIHNRMPAILSGDNAARWLGDECRENARAFSLLKPFAADQMTGYEVSTLVNDPRNDVPECVAPAGHEKKLHAQLSML